MSFFKNLLKGTLGVVAAPFTGGASLGLTADAVLGAGTQLIGGVMGQRAEGKAIDAQNQYNSPAAIRARAEAAGFNPLSFIGPGVGNQTATGGSNYMGAAIADAGLMLADSMSRKKESQKVSALQVQNQKLVDHIQSLTLRPKVGGIYASRQQTPTLSKSLGGANSASSIDSASIGFGRSIPEIDPVDPRRDVDDAKIKNHSGFMVIDNPFLPFPIHIPTMDGDEPLHWYDYPSLVLPATVSGGRAFGAWVKDKHTASQKAALKASGQRVYSIGGKTYAEQPPKSAAEKRGFWNNFWGAYGGAY